MAKIPFTMAFVALGIWPSVIGRHHFPLPLRLSIFSSTFQVTGRNCNPDNDGSTPSCNINKQLHPDIMVLQCMRRMALFSHPLVRVNYVRHFARYDDQWQYLVSLLSYESPVDTAWLIPLPVSADQRTTAVEFLDLEDSPDFFDRLGRLFPESVADTPSGQDPVACVGTYLPTFGELESLAEEHRPAPEVMENLSPYQEYGVVLVPLPAGEHTTLPLALKFHPALADTLSFPNRQLIGESYDTQCDFNQLLYSQFDYVSELDGWDKSPELASAHFETPPACGIIEPGLTCFRFALTGRRDNGDVVIR